MLISYNRPAMTFTTNGAFIGDPSAMTNGRPAETARLTTPASGPTTIAATFSSNLSPRFFCLLNTTFPPGATVTLTFGAGTYTGTITGGARGEQNCYILLPTGIAAASTCSISIASGVAGASVQDIGEFWIAGAADIPITPGYGVKVNDSSIVQQSFAKQPYVQRGAIWRTLHFTPAPVGPGMTGLWTQAQFDALFANLDRGQTAMYVPIYTDETGAVSPSVIAREAMMGTLSQPPENKHLAARIFGPSEMQVVESPVPV